MKLGPVDGSVEEVRDLLENNGLRLEDYLEKSAAGLNNGVAFFAEGAYLFLGGSCRTNVIGIKTIITPIHWVGWQ